MGASSELQRWAARLCMSLVAVLALMGYHFGNVRFVPIAAGFAILGGVFYSGRLVPAPSRPLGDSGRRRAL